MQVKDRMSSNPVTVGEDTSFEDALRLMKERKIRRLPVTGKDGRLVGIVVEKDLLYASPSPATSLSVFEIHYLLAKMRIRDVMTRRVITVGPDCPLEEAARIMVDHRIGSLPVMTDGTMVGIITETDIFKTFVEILGGREPGLRLTLDVKNNPGVLAAVAADIARANGNVISVASFRAPDVADRVLTLKVSGADRESLLASLRAAGAVVLDVRDVVEGGYQPHVVDERSRPFAEV